MNLSLSFRIQPHEIVALVGGGGKTTTLFRLADELAARGKRVVITTTTRLATSQVKSFNQTTLRYEDHPNFIARVTVTLAQSSQVLIVGENLPDDKVSGIPCEIIDQIATLNEVDAIIYEADGSRTLPFKAPALHEPVLAESTTLLVPVIGLSALGQPLDDAHVHRAEIVARLAGAQIGKTVTPLIAARVLAHRHGGVKAKPRGARAIALVNQVETDEQLNSARELAKLLLGYETISAVAIGAVKNPEPIRETHRRIAAIALAAGAGTRMIGHVKQLLPWQGKTLIEHAIDLATHSQANEMLVVLGARADEIRATIRHTPARVVLNQDWQTGHASSIRAGLRALSPHIDAAIFLNADQPYLTTEVIDTLIQHWRETDAAIIVSAFAGRRGSPVLFARKHFAELENLQGEQGGRELIAKYKGECVGFANAQLGIDVDTLDEYRKLT